MYPADKMGRLLLKLRRKSVRKFKTSWENHLGSKSRSVPIAMLIGVTAAVAAAILHKLVELLESGIMKLQFSESFPVVTLYLLTPFIGIILSYIVQRTVGGNRYSKSLSPLILSLNRRRTNIPLRETFNHILSSAISVGCGGSAGLEAPSVLTGAAIGANTAGFFEIDRRQRMLMIGCGAAAAI